ncbi:GntR family transcriptional regulator [Sphingobium yanoikuyae]|uniref:GntR family transcriptional regulator n=1 Tax=Sphingobium yanoikuyae TaxID=13690 RepID=UPI00243100F7|nr:GntR family transcriptional regulator [Sphingobium yanoikuyae]
MSPEAITADRIYSDLKRQIVGGNWRPGSILAVTQIANHVGTSVTPVRDAIQKLVGEGFVALLGTGGFFIPRITTRSMADLYGWHSDLVRLALRDAQDIEAIGPFPGCEKPGFEQDIRHVVGLTEELFCRLAACSPNANHQSALLTANDRLHVMRLHEPSPKRRAREIEVIWNALVSGNRNGARSMLWSYHRRRSLAVENIFRSMKRSGYVAESVELPVNEDDYKS